MAKIQFTQNVGVPVSDEDATTHYLFRQGEKRTVKILDYPTAETLLVEFDDGCTGEVATDTVNVLEYEPDDEAFPCRW